MSFRASPQKSPGENSIPQISLNMSLAVDLNSNRNIEKQAIIAKQKLG